MFGSSPVESVERSLAESLQSIQEPCIAGPPRGRQAKRMAKKATAEKRIAQYERECILGIIWPWPAALLPPSLLQTLCRRGT